MARDFPAKTVDETKVYTFDFTPEVADDAVLDTPVIEQFEAADGVTPSTDMTLASPSVVGKKVLVLGSGGVEGEAYKLRAKVDDDNGQTHVIWAKAAIKEAAGKAAA